MRPEYRSIAKAEVNYEDSQFIGVDILVAIGRKLTDGEQLQIYTKVSDIYKMLRRNTILESKEYIDDVIKEREQMLGLFHPVPIFMEIISNEYDNDGLYPWYMITTSKGRIKIGWRKRVINIDWSDASALIEIDGRKLFLGENTTVDRTYIHAWGYDKAKEYIHILLNIQL